MATGMLCNASNESKSFRLWSKALFGDEVAIRWWIRANSMNAIWFNDSQWIIFTAERARLVCHRRRPVCQHTHFECEMFFIWRSIVLNAVNCIVIHTCITRKHLRDSRAYKGSWYRQYTSIGDSFWISNSLTSESYLGSTLEPSDHSPLSSNNFEEPIKLRN